MRSCRNHNRTSTSLFLSATSLSSRCEKQVRQQIVSNNEIRLDHGCCKHRLIMTTFIWFVRPKRNSHQGCKRTHQRGATSEAQEVQLQLKPNQSGATSRMWIDEARPQAGEHPLADDDIHSHDVKGHDALSLGLFHTVR